jgi:uncharacterized protein YndB with AHSA1/START domain
MDNKSISIEAIVNAPIDKIWQYWNTPEHITKWAFASDTWEAPHAENDLRTGGRFLTRMQAKDGSGGFDFEGTYTHVAPNEVIEYEMDDGRKVTTVFSETTDGVKVNTTFDLEHENTEEKQREGWQAILNNFKKYVENN